MTMKIGCEPYLRAASLFIRYTVFVLEKGIAAEDEFDQNDEKGTIYAVLYRDQMPVSTARFLPQSEKQARLTRVATLKDERSKGYGAQIIQALEQYARDEGFEHLVIHSELTARAFYEKIGYKPFGSIYEEDGEPCQSLEKYLKGEQY
ncbi:GNAT family N-acetyltransferase [Streptococcus merionis]|uniref:GNAT family N-acetyltransferase n=1 Tax=Streptococcus merionis TaxID=400065 RepID=UPI0035190CCD